MSLFVWSRHHPSNTDLRLSYPWTHSPWGCRVSSWGPRVDLRPRLCSGLRSLRRNHSDLRSRSWVGLQWSLHSRPRLQRSGSTDWDLSRCYWIVCLSFDPPDLSSHWEPKRRRRLRYWRPREEEESGRAAADWESAAASCSYAASSIWLSGFETKPRDKVLF